MNHPCEIIRDLIPLCLDQTASSASREAVKAHLRDCPDCTAIYADMSLALPGDAGDAPASGEVDQTIRILRRKKRRRTLCAALLILFIALLAAGAALLGLRALERSPVPLSTDGITVTLSRFSRTQTHPLVMTVDTDAPHSALFPVLTHAQERSFDIVYLQLFLPSQETPSVLDATRHTMDLTDLLLDADGRLLLKSTGADDAPLLTEITEVRLGTPEHFRVLYRAGAALPEVSSSYRVYDRALEELPDALAHLLPDALCGDLSDFPSLSDHNAYWEHYCYMLTERSTRMRQLAPEFIAP